MDRAAACRQLFFREKPFACHDSLFIRTLTEIVQKRYTSAPLTPDGPPPLPSAENARVQGPPGSTCHPPGMVFGLVPMIPGDPTNLKTSHARGEAWHGNGWITTRPSKHLRNSVVSEGEAPRSRGATAPGSTERGVFPHSNVQPMPTDPKGHHNGIRRIRAEGRRQNPGQRRDAQRLLPATGDQQRRPADGFAR